MRINEKEQSFSRVYRLTKTDEFSSVFGFRRVVRGAWLNLHYLPRGNDSTARLGLVVGKKFLKKSVDRNRCKRILREQFRLMRSMLPPCDCVVRLTGKNAPLDAKTLAADFLHLLSRLPR